MQTTRRRLLKGAGIATTAAAVGSFGAMPAAATDGVVTVGNFQGLSRPQLNPLQVTQTTPGETLALIYDGGLEFDPRAGEFVPWGFESVDVRPGNVGTDDPTVVATLRDGYTFHDGVPVTAEDVRVTFETIVDNGLDGTQTIGDLSAVSAVRTPDERTVEYVFDEPLATFRADLLALPILPAHRWRDYDPTSTDPVEDGLIGSGPFAVAELSVDGSPSEDRIAFSARDDYVVTDAFDALGPFVDRIEASFFPGNPEGFKSLTQAVRTRELDLAVQVSPKAAKQFQQDDCFTLVNNAPDGFTFVPYNTRRRPFDDRAFRRALSTLWDGDRFVNDVLSGFGSPGDYAVPPAFPEVRPATTEETSQYDYPEASDGSLDVTTARDLFRTADSDREYTFGPVVSDSVTGDRELYVDGQPVTQFHSDNDGTGGQGPLEFLEFNQRLGVAGDQWLADMREVGIPVVGKTPSFGEVLERGFATFEFDFFQIALNGVEPTYSYLSDLFASDGGLNAPGYGGADDALSESDATLDEDRRERLLTDAVERVYDDQPVLVAGYSEEVSPAYGEFTGFVRSIGNVFGKFSFLGLRRAPVVGLDVKPGSGDPTPINPNARGVTPVAVTAANGVDPTRIDASTVRFGDSEAVNTCGGAEPVADGEAIDVTGDGETDRLFRFRTQELAVDDGTEAVRFVGRLDDGSPVRGQATVRVTGGRN